MDAVELDYGGSRALQFVVPYVGLGVDKVNKFRMQLM
jgi:hypothetical protein